MKRKLSPKALYGVVAGALLVYALFGWFVLVAPKRSEAATLKEQVAGAEQALAAARLAAVVMPDVQPIAVADIYRLSTAMPSSTDMAGILLELSRIADETGIQFNSIAPAPAASAGAYQSIPITLDFNGNFYELSDFLFRLRTLVGVRRGELHSLGRLFIVRSLSFAAGGAAGSDLTAGLNVEAFVQGTGTPATTATPTAPPPAETTGTDTTAEVPVPPIEGEASAAPEVAP